jgi:hypothetical protein
MVKGTFWKIFKKKLSHLKEKTVLKMSKFKKITKKEPTSSKKDFLRKTGLNSPYFEGKGKKKRKKKG